MNVSVRVGSPGSDGTVTQGNNATATGTSPALGVVNVSGGSNTNVSIAIPGPAQGAPTGGAWTWNWIWDGSWTPPPGAIASDVAPTASDVWNWLWQNQPAGGQAAAGSTASTQGTSGQWLWTWTWTLPGGKVWTLDWQQACDCSWTWNWNWDWSSGAPASTPPDPSSDGGGDDPPASDDTLFGAVTQENDATATATATISATVDTTLDQTQTGVDPSLGRQHVWGGQTTVNAQSAIVTAEAHQTRPVNRIMVFGVPTASVTQVNSVSADASADLFVHLLAGVQQQQAGAVTDDQWLEADQWVGSEQVAAVTAIASQSDAQNLHFVSAMGPNQARIDVVDQRNSASASASAQLAAHVEAWIGQYQAAGVASLQEADATQVLVNEQSAVVGSVVSQHDVRNVDVVVVPAGSRAVNPSLRQQNSVFTTDSAGDYSVLYAWIVQAQDGDVDAEFASAAQDATATQTAAVSSQASQLRLLNIAHWRGVEPPPDATPLSQPKPTDTGSDTSTQDGAQSAVQQSKRLSSIGSVRSTSGVVLRLGTTLKTGATIRGHAGGKKALEGRGGTLHVAPGAAGGGGPGIGQADSAAQATEAGQVAAASAIAGALGLTGNATGLPVIAGSAASLTASGTTSGSSTAATAFSAFSASTASTASTASSSTSSAAGPNSTPLTPSSTTSPRDEGNGAHPTLRAMDAGGPVGPSSPCCGSSADLGAGGTTLPTGGGLSGLALPSYKLAAPAPFGPQSPAPVLGRSVAFNEPFERPG
jgi:hypothetical protein